MKLFFLHARMHITLFIANVSDVELELSRSKLRDSSGVELRMVRKLLYMQLVVFWRTWAVGKQ
jgi:hypothetical protein